MDKDKYEKIKYLMPKAGKPSIVSNYQFLCASLYIIEGQKQIADRDYAKSYSSEKSEILTATLIVNDEERCIEFC